MMMTMTSIMSPRISLLSAVLLLGTANAQFTEIKLYSDVDCADWAYTWVADGALGRAQRVGTWPAALARDLFSEMRLPPIVVVIFLLTVGLPNEAKADVGDTCALAFTDEECDESGCQICDFALNTGGVCSAKDDGTCCTKDEQDGACVEGWCTISDTTPEQCDETRQLKTKGEKPTPAPSPVCPEGSDMCSDPHMKGLRGQKIEWSGIDGGWYCMVRDDDADVHVNVRLTAPLPEEFPDRQLITGLSIISEGHSVTIEVKNPYDIDTNGCPQDVSPCLANGGLRAVVDEQEVDGLLRSSRNEYMADGIAVSASNLPVECRQFGGDKIWARMYDEMLRGSRELASEEQFEDWILRFDGMAAPDWCTRYIAEHDLTDVQSIHAIFKIMNPSVTVRLSVGSNHQGDGELDWDGRVLPDLEFWQMDVGLVGLSLENESLSGILGETARPVLDKDGRAVMEGDEAFRGNAEDYRVSGSLGTHFALLDKKDEYQ